MLCAPQNGAITLLLVRLNVVCYVKCSFVCSVWNVTLRYLVFDVKSLFLVDYLTTVLREGRDVVTTGDRPGSLPLTCSLAVYLTLAAGLLATQVKSPVCRESRLEMLRRLE